MALVLPGILSLLQHLDTFRKDPEAYRPKKCPGCSHGILWCHGFYTRKADRSDMNEALDPVPIPRFFCPDCRSTCSMLPECLPARSWYLWQVRQITFLLLLAGNSIGRTISANGSRACRQTVQRWWRRFQDGSPLYSFHLRAHFPRLGRHDGFTDFWTNCLAFMPLSTVMRLLHEENVPVP